MKTVYGVVWAEDHMGYGDPEACFPNVVDAVEIMGRMKPDYCGQWEVVPVKIFDSVKEYEDFSEPEDNEWYDEHWAIIHEAIRKAKDEKTS